MSTLFSLFVNLFIVPATSKKSEAGQGGIEFVVIAAFVGIVVVGVIFIVLPMLGLGTATAAELQGALGQ